MLAVRSVSIKLSGLLGWIETTLVTYIITIDQLGDIQKTKVFMDKHDTIYILMFVFAMKGQNHERDYLGC